jgi:hypothetical protein
MTIPIQAQAFNPITGVFGDGNVRFFTASGTWTVPSGVGKVRVRLWGGGGPTFNTSTFAAGSGGGFALKAIYDLAGVTSIAVTVGVGGTTSSSGGSGGTSSFGSYCSATGGSALASGSTGGGTGTGGDLNFTGGAGSSSATNTQTSCGGAANVFGNGSAAVANAVGLSGTSGAGGASGLIGGDGINSTGGRSATVFATSGQTTPYSIDFIGTGGGGFGGSVGNGINGGGAGYNALGGFPAGGGWGGDGRVTGGAGLVIVEW